MRNREVLKKIPGLYALVLAATFYTALAQQPAKPPMPLGVAWQNVNAVCAMAIDELLVGKQAKATRESLAVLQKALMIYEQYTTVK